MNAHTPTTALRRYTVEFDQSYLPTPLNWKLRLWGQSVGGYGVLKGNQSSRYQTREAAEAVGAIFVETGITPAHQTAERIEAARGDEAATRRAA